MPDFACTPSESGTHAVTIHLAGGNGEAGT
jgi:hypothetical protein